MAFELEHILAEKRVANTRRRHVNAVDAIESLPEDTPIAVTPRTNAVAAIVQSAVSWMHMRLSSLMQPPHAEMRECMCAR